MISYKTQYLRNGARLTALAVLIAQPLLTRGQDDRNTKSKQLTVTNPPVIFQAAGPTATSIQSTVDEFRAAIGGANNGNVAGPVNTGRREINWDGGGSTATSPGPTPFTVFQNNRGAVMETPGSGFVQAPPSGLADTFHNPSLTNTFKAFSPARLFAPVGSTLTDVIFFVPGGGTNALTSGFGVVFADVDSPDGGGRGVRQSKLTASTQIGFYDSHGKLLYKSAIPSSPGAATFSFFAILFPDPRIASVRIITGREDPSRGLDPQTDLVVMDDFIYAEPQPAQ